MPDGDGGQPRHLPAGRPSYLQMEAALTPIPSSVLRRLATGLAAVSVAVLAAVALPAVAPAAPSRAIPAPVEDARPIDASSEVAVIAGGCFWGVQGVFQHVAGVTSAVSGYAGGEQASARYEVVSGGDSGHAEAVQITFDPRKISYGAILQIFFSVAHDPTELDRQGPDVGPQYRSTIFPGSAGQGRVARSYIAQLNASRAFDAPVVTTIETGRRFYPAEDYHQDYLTRHPSQPYIVAHDLPKLAALQRIFPDRYRAKPELVGR